MYINKTSRRLIFLNAIFFAWLVSFIIDKFGFENAFSVANFFDLFLFSFVFESLRPFGLKRKLIKIRKMIGGKTLVRLEPCEEAQPEMEEM